MFSQAGLALRPMLTAQLRAKGIRLFQPLEVNVGCSRIFSPGDSVI